MNSPTGVPPQPSNPSYRTPSVDALFRDFRECDRGILVAPVEESGMRFGELAALTWATSTWGRL